jgi:hypothetical protein
MRGWCLVPLLVLSACKSETMERDQMGLWKSRDQLRSESGQAKKTAKGEPEPEPEQAAPPKGRVVTIPPEAAAAQADFSNRPSTIFSDVVEIDLSRAGWLALASFSVSRDAVIRRDEEDAERGILTITLQRVPNVAATKDSIPTVRFGDGLRVVGIDRVVLRFWSQPSVERPMWFHAVGAGKRAVYSIDGEPPREWRGRAVDVRAELHLVAETYKFDFSAEAKP